MTHENDRAHVVATRWMLVGPDQTEGRLRVMDVHDETTVAEIIHWCRETGLGDAFEVRLVVQPR